MSSLPTGQVTIQEKNICPSTYHGGTLFRVTQFFRSLTNAMIVNNEIYVQRPTKLPPGVTGEFSGDSIDEFGPPFPQVGMTATLYNIFTPMLFSYAMVCYYNNGCPEEGPNVSSCQWNGATYLVGINLSAQEKVQISIDNFRVGQTVFEPSASDGVSTDLVTKKPYAVELTLSGSIPSQHKDLLARADLFVNGVFYSSSAPFKVGNIVNGQSKTFIFGREDVVGTKNLRVDVVPVSPQAGVFDTTASVNRNVNFYDVSLSLLVNEIIGCAPLVTNCFAAPTAQDIDFFNTKQIPLAQELLPISGDSLTVTKGLNWALSIPDVNSNGDSMYLDTAFIWIQKKIALKDLGIGLVGNDYFLKHGYILSTGKALGVVFSTQNGIALVSGLNPTVLTHELLHNLKNIPKHSLSLQAEGVGKSANEIWTTGQPLDPFIILGDLANNIFFARSPNSAPYGVGSTEYNIAFKTLRSGKIDPKVVLVAGVIGPNGENKYFQAQRGEAFLDPSIESPDLTIQGLNSSGAIVASVQIKSSNQKFKSKVQIKSSNQKFKSKVQIKSSNQKFKSKVQIKSS